MDETPDMRNENNGKGKSNTAEWQGQERVRWEGQGPWQEQARWEGPWLWHEDRWIGPYKLAAMRLAAISEAAARRD